VHQHTAQVTWERKGATFRDHLYSRAHLWRFDGGAEVPASSSPLVVRAPLSDPRAVDPEEAFVAAAASCHMLFFLDFAARAGFVVETYRDDAVATMGRDADGREFVETIVLRPQISFAAGSTAPSPEEIAALHHRSHEACFIANSVKTKISIAVA
jgi:organic hydroperoxide reductase OsmC/OhrA